MDNRAIGVFDSGLGGLTAVRELRKILPHENIVYFGDTGRVPYGTRSKETITKYALEDIAFLRRHNVKMILAACGTVSTVVPSETITAQPDMPPYSGVLYPSAQRACALSQNGVIGVIGTTATVRSAAYGKAIRSIRPEAKVIGNACPLLVPLVENGLIDFENKITRLALEMYLKPLIHEGVDTLILGCTHYPILYDIISDILGYQVTLIDAGQEVAIYAQNYLTQNNMLCAPDQSGGCEFYVSDAIEGFSETAHILLGSEIKGHVQQINLDTLYAL